MPPTGRAASGSRAGSAWMPDDGGRGRPRRRSVTAPADRTRRAEPTRFAAYTLLRAVADGAYANLEMSAVLRRHRLEGRDAAFATELAFGTIRWQGFYDAVVAEAAGRPTSRIDPQVLDVLRLGSHQLLGMRVATHAAADQTVGLTRAVAGAGASGFVNAVLRRISERTLEQWREAVVPEGGGAAALAVRHSHPEWVVSALRAALLGHGRATPGTVDGELTSLLEADNEPPQVHLVARPGLSTVDELVAAGDVERSTGSPIGAVLVSGDPGDLAAVRDGRAAIQDEGSQLVALALATAQTVPGLPARWLDLCAGPGGKAGVLGALALRTGADLVANEVSQHRADLVRSTLRPVAGLATRSGHSVDVRTADARRRAPAVHRRGRGLPGGARRGSLRAALAARARDRRDVLRAAAASLGWRACRSHRRSSPQTSPTSSGSWAPSRTPTGRTSTSWTTTSCPTSPSACRSSSGSSTGRPR